MLIRISRIVALFSLLAILLAACAPAPETQATAEVAPTEAAVTEPATTEGPAPAQEGGWCSGTNIVFFPGGSPGGGFETVVYNGALQAAADTGANVEYLWSDWDASKMVTQLQNPLAPQPQ